MSINNKNLLELFAGEENLTLATDIYRFSLNPEEKKKFINYYMDEHINKYLDIIVVKNMTLYTYLNYLNSYEI